ncbi:MAG: four helix bundle protein [Patescibacteria group bacterium]|jgi:four helix bundle protein
MDSQGYKKLVVWKNASILRKKVYDLSRRFSKSELRRVSQMTDAARSVKQNIQEGYRQPIGRYIHSLKNICQGSLSELHGDIEDCYEDGLITKEEFSELDELCGKTDYLFSKLVDSLQKKQRQEKFNQESVKLCKSSL